jgi:pilus assembly protein FimV
VKNALLRGVLAALLALLVPWAAHAAGLGRLNVLSSLGQPLRAEIELISVQPGDVATLIVRVAPPEAYRQANVPYNLGDAAVRVSVQQRADGQPYISVTSLRPVNEPFMNLLIEMSWSAGIITREYAVLLDPPGYTPPQVAAAPAPAAPPAAVATPAAPRPAPVAVPAPAPAPAAPKPAAAAREYTVKRGDTLSRIARSVRPEGMSVEQMLVALYRANPDAFINNNMNLLRAGATLRVPGADELGATTQTEARQEIRLHTADWQRYRQRLADTAGPARESRTDPEQRKITVQDKAPADRGRPVLRLSSGEPAKGAPSAERVRALEEELIARERELSEAQRRIKELEKAAATK